MVTSLKGGNAHFQLTVQERLERLDGQGGAQGGPGSQSGHSA